MAQPAMTQAAIIAPHNRPPARTAEYPSKRMRFKASVRPIRAEVNHVRE